MRLSRHLFVVTLFFGFLIWYWWEDTAIPLLTLAAILTHEGGHCVAALLCGVPLRKFRLVPWEARISLGTQSLSYQKECIISLAGPLANLLSFLLVKVRCGSSAGGAATFFSAASLSLALLNLLPIDDFDGGRFFRCICSATLGLRVAEILCDILSFFTLFCLWCASVYLLIRVNDNLSLFLFSGTLFLRIFIHRRSC